MTQEFDRPKSILRNSTSTRMTETGWFPLPSASALFLAAASLALIPSQLHAQFQAPTPEELKMTAEPADPGAAAVYLYREENVDDNIHIHTFYTRIKILTEKGKGLATVSVPYPKGPFSVTDIKARTIHADGTVIPLDVKPSDLVEQRGSAFQINRMVFTLPSVEVGSILEYRWVLRYDDERLAEPHWDIQQPYFVRKAHYSFAAFRSLNRVVDANGESSGNLLYTSMLPKGITVVQQASGKYVLDVVDVSPVPDEEYMPPMDTLRQQVVFYYSKYFTKEDYWKQQGEHWSKEMDRFANESKTIKDAVGALVAPGDNEDVKARKIYDAVMALDNTDYSRRKSAAEMKQLGLKQARQAEDVWNQKSGTSDEIALLYLAMARSAGLKAYAMVVCNRNRTVFNPYFMSMDQFDDVLVLVSINGKEVVLDPGKKYESFAQLDWRHTLTSALRQADKGPGFCETPGNSYKEASTLRTADINLAADGTVSGTIRITMNGPAALRWRERAVESDEAEVKKEFDESLHRMVPDGVDAEFDHFLGLEDFHTQLMAVAKISGNMGTSTGKRVFLPGVFFESRAKHPFVAEEKRLTGIDMEYAETVHDEVTYHLPDSYVVESAPTDTAIPWAGHAALQLKASTDKNSVVVGRSFIRAFTRLPATDYSPLRDFYQKVATADQQQLVLTVSAGTKAGGQ